MEFLAYALGDWSVLLVVLLAILGVALAVLGAALFTLWFLLAYSRRNRNDQGSLDYEVEATEPPDDESESCAEDSWGSGKVWGEKMRS